MKNLCRAEKKRFVRVPGIFSHVIVLFSFVFGSSFLISFPQSDNKIDTYYVGQLQKFQKEVEKFRQLCTRRPSLQELKDQFAAIRTTYKQLAVLTEYFNPYETKYLNGPALNWVQEDKPDLILPPHGLQVIEEYIFNDWSSTSFPLLIQELEQILKQVSGLENERDRSLKFKDEYVFDALRSSVVRMITLGITGFDSPVAEHSLSEANATISGIGNILSLYRRAIDKKNTGLYERISYLLDKARSYLSSNADFNSFDRLDFIQHFANPLYSLLGEARTSLGISAPAGKRPVRPGAVSIFDSGAFDINFFSPDERYRITKERIELGKRLFYDPILSGNNTRSCASCHKPERAFTDGLTVPKSFDNKTLLSRNTPTILNSVFQTRQFYDSRTDVLENQLEEVVHNAEEMKGSLKQSIGDLKKHPVYQSLFQKAYADNKDPLSAYNIANAISSYVRSLVIMNTRFDQYMRGDEKALKDDEKKGFNLFAGKAKCATCHFIPLFNGLVPPEFNETESEVLGVPQKNSKGRTKLDPDLGKYNFTKAEIHKYAFKTPTLRNIALTAPYMHNGVFKTLKEVVDFYNDGGGYGWKIDPPNQTLPKQKLNLTRKEKKQLIAFLKTLTQREAVSY